MKKNFKLFQRIGFVFAISALIFTSAARPDTTSVSGPIVNANWTLAGSPYVVTGDISITGLIIDPGVSVLFAGNYEFLVSGVIEAIGTEQSQIIFTTKTGVASWKGIRFQNSLPGSFMKWCIVEKANTSGIRILDSPLKLFNCTITNNQTLTYGGGIFISNTVNHNIDLTECTISNNLIPSGQLTIGGGIRVTSNGVVRFVSCKIENNSITTISNGSCTGGGVSIEGSASAQFIDCSIQRNSVIGIGNSATHGGGVYVSGNASFSNCIINGNKCTGTGGSSDSYGGGIYNDGNISISNSIIAWDTLSSGRTNRGSGIYSRVGQLKIDNSTLSHNRYQAIWNISSNVTVINSILFFNYNLGSGMYGPQLDGAFNITYSDVQVQGGPAYPGVGNINNNPNFDSPICLKLLPGSPCIDAGKDTIIYRDACFPPSLGNTRNDMGAYGGPGACNWLNFENPPCFTPPVSSINIELTALMQGLYNPSTNMMARTQSEILYLRNATCPYAIVEPAAATLSQNGISSPEFIFNSSPSGTYYLVTKNWNSLETWNKAGGELLYNDGETNFYDFTTAPSQAYGNNLIQIDDSPLRYGIYIGDVSQFGAIDLADVLAVYQDASAFRTGYVVTDLNGDYQVNLTDVLIAYNNSVAFVAKKPPLCPP